MKMNSSLLFNASHDYSCNSSNRSFFCMIDQDLLKIEVLTMTLELIFSLIGNSLVFLIILLRRFGKKTNRRMKRAKLTRMDFYILQLSVADTYVSLGNILTMVNIT